MIQKVQRKHWQRQPCKVTSAPEARTFRTATGLLRRRGGAGRWVTPGRRLLRPSLPPRRDGVGRYLRVARHGVGRRPRRRRRIGRHRGQRRVREMGRVVELVRGRVRRRGGLRLLAGVRITISSMRRIARAVSRIVGRVRGHRMVVSMLLLLVVLRVLLLMLRVLRKGFVRRRLPPPLPLLIAPSFIMPRRRHFTFHCFRSTSPCCVSPQQRSLSARTAFCDRREEWRCRAPNGCFFLAGRNGKGRFWELSKFDTEKSCVRARGAAGATYKTS